MEQVENGTNFTALNFGKLADVLTNHAGKIFLKDAMKSSGVEVSVSSLPAKTDLPIFHSHKQNEEVYIFLSGAGKFQVDDKCFDIAEGSVIRIAPEGLRGMTNTSDEQMIYLVIQAKENSLEQYTMEDGVLHDVTPLWK